MRKCNQSSSLSLSLSLDCISTWAFSSLLDTTWKRQNQTLNMMSIHWIDHSYGRMRDLCLILPQRGLQNWTRSKFRSLPSCSTSHSLSGPVHSLTLLSRTLRLTWSMFLPNVHAVHDRPYSATVDMDGDSCQWVLPIPGGNPGLPSVGEASELIPSVPGGNPMPHLKW